MESSQPSYLGNPNLHRQAVWLCFYNRTGFHAFWVTTIFGKSHDQNRNKKFKTRVVYTSEYGTDG